MVITITLPWPPKKLHAHNTGHWRSKSSAVKSYREIGYLSGLDAQVQLRQAEIVYRFCMPDSRRRDQANMIQSMKPAIDGIVDSKLIPDDNWKTLRIAGVEVEVDRENPRVELIFDGPKT